MIDFTDVDPDAWPRVGEPMRMVFRVKGYDTRCGFRRCFWKAAPAKGSPGEGAEARG